MYIYAPRRRWLWETVVNGRANGVCVDGEGTRGGDKT
jgi:hypothetical protein